MSKKRLFLFITSSFLAVFILIIISFATKIIFGGLNINFLEQRLLSFLENEHKISLKSEDYILMYNQDNGLFIDVSKTDLYLSDKTSFSTNQIIIDFELKNLFLTVKII